MNSLLPWVTLHYRLTPYHRDMRRLIADRERGIAPSRQHFALLHAGWGLGGVGAGYGLALLAGHWWAAAPPLAVAGWQAWRRRSFATWQRRRYAALPGLRAGGDAPVVALTVYPDRLTVTVADAAPTLAVPWRDVARLQLEAELLVIHLRHGDEVLIPPASPGIGVIDLTILHRELSCLLVGQGALPGDVASPGAGAGSANAPPLALATSMAQ